MMSMPRCSSHAIAYSGGTSKSWQTWLLFGLAYGIIFWPAFSWMVERFEAADSFYSHGWLVPFASAWLIWQRRACLKSSAMHASFWGLAVLIPSLALHVLATWWQVHIVSGLAMVTALWGLVWTLCGWRTLWMLRVPLLFLLFMVPLPGVLLIEWSFRLKLLAAWLATHVLHAIGVPALQTGSSIQLPGLSVLVDDTCSGLRSLISLLAMAVLWVASLPQATQRWRKLSIIALSVPIALCANVVRIVLLVMLSVIYGSAAAEDFVHYGSGIVVFGLSLIGLVWLTRWLTGTGVRHATPRGAANR